MYREQQVHNEITYANLLKPKSKSMISRGFQAPMGDKPHPPANKKKCKPTSCF